MGAMLLTLLLEPRGFFPPGFWGIAAWLLVGLLAFLWVLVGIVRRLWRSDSQVARLIAWLLVLGLAVAVMYFWRVVLHF